MPLVRLAGLLLVLASPVLQAEKLEIIELPAEQPQPAKLSLNWDCDVLLLTTSQRYRPGSCKQDGEETRKAKELPVEHISLESAEQAPSRKVRYQ